MKRIADDFGFCDAIDQGILALAKADKISGTSIMVGGFSCQNNAHHLKAIKKQNPQFELGLHLVLSETLLPMMSNETHFYPSLNHCLIKSHIGGLDKGWLKDEISQQYQSFTEIFGTEPDYIDGHMHVHMLPIIRDILFDMLEEYSFKGWVRYCGVPFSSAFRLPHFSKVMVLKQLSQPFLKEARRRHILTNKKFLGIYDFAPHGFANCWEKWQKEADENTVIMCHPAHPDISPLKGDKIAAARIEEFHFLSSLF